MKETTSSPPREWKGFNRWAYGAFLMLVAYFALSGQYSDAIINLGIALVFDPFDTTVTWAKRPLWQRAWMLVHLAILLVGFCFLIF